MKASEVGKTFNDHDFWEHPMISMQKPSMFGVNGSRNLCSKLDPTLKLRTLKANGFKLDMINMTSDCANHLRGPNMDNNVLFDNYKSVTG